MQSYHEWIEREAAIERAANELAARFDGCDHELLRTIRMRGADPLKSVAQSRVKPEQSGSRPSETGSGGTDHAGGDAP